MQIRIVHLVMIIMVYSFFLSAPEILGFSVASRDRLWAPHLFDVTYLDSLNIIAVGDFGAIKKSTDAGLTWSDQHSGTVLDLTSVEFMTPLEGVVVGDSAIILRTTDGGILWTPVYGHINEKLFDVCMIDGNTLVSAGTDRSVYSKPLLLRSTDRGLTWSNVTLTNPPSIIDIERASENAIFMVGHQELLRSSDAGVVWTETSMMPLSVLGVSFCNPDRGLIGAYNSNEVQDVVLRTTDGGNSWEQHYLDSSGAHPFVTDIMFADSNNAFVVTMNGGIYHSSDGGMQWVRQYIAPTQYSGEMGIACWSPSIAVVVGPDGLILRTMDSGDTWSVITGVNDNAENSLPIRYQLDNAYPNPFNNSTIIQYELPVETHVTVVVHDLLGNNISQLTDKVQPPGQYTVPWDASGQPSGIYFLELRAGVYRSIKKLVLLR